MVLHIFNTLTFFVTLYLGWNPVMQSQDLRIQVCSNYPKTLTRFRHTVQTHSSCHWILSKFERIFRSLFKIHIWSHRSLRNESLHCCIIFPPSIAKCGTPATDPAPVSIHRLLPFGKFIYGSLTSNSSGLYQHQYIECWEYCYSCCSVMIFLTTHYTMDNRNWKIANELCLLNNGYLKMCDG